MLPVRRTNDSPRKRLLPMGTALLGAILCLLLVVLHTISGNVFYSTQKSFTITGNVPQTALKDFSLDEQSGILTSTSDDPWITLDLNSLVRCVQVDIQVDFLSQSSTLCQIYYSSSDEYSEKNSVTAQLTENRNTISLHGIPCKQLRLDLCDTSGAQIKVSEISIFTRTVNIVSTSLFFCSALMMVVSGIYLFVLHRYTIQKIFSRIYDLSIAHPLLSLVLLTSVSALLVYWKFLFGLGYYAYYDIGSDTVHQYQAMLMNIVHHIKAGDISLWTFEFGLGTHASDLLNYLVDPFCLISIAAGCLGGFKAMLTSLAWAQCLRILCCAILCYRFLSFFHFKPFSKIAASYLYSFCGFLILWGQHYNFSTAFVYLTLLMCTLEYAISNPKLVRAYLLFALSLALQAIKSYYFTYMSLLACAIYAIYRLVRQYLVKKEIKTFFCCGFALLAAVFLGVCMAGSLFLPSASAMLSTSDRVSGSQHLFNSQIWHNMSHNFTVFCRLLSNNLQGISNYTGYANYYEAEQLFFSSFFPIFLIAFVLGRRNERKHLFGRIIVAACLFFSLVSVIFGTVFNAFVSHSGRFTYVLMPLFSLIVAKALDVVLDREHPYPMGIFLTLSTAFYGVFAVLYLTQFQGSQPLLLLVLMGQALLLLAVLAWHQKRSTSASRRPVQVLVLLIFLCNIVPETMLTVSHRTTIDDVFDVPATIEETERVQECISWLEEYDEEFFRMEKTYLNYTGFNDSLREGYPGISVYNSTHNYKVTNFYQNTWTKIMYNDVGAYYLFPQDFTNADMAGLLGVKYIISNSEISDQPLYQLIHQTESGRYIYRNTACTGFSRLYTQTMSYDEFALLNEGERQTALQHFLISDWGHTAAPISQAPETSMVHLWRNGRDSHLTGIVDSETGGYVFLPIPYDQGWSATVNGMNVDILEVDYGFMAIPVDAGDVKFSLDYTPVLQTTGNLLTLVGISIFLLVLFASCGKPLFHSCRALLQKQKRSPHHDQL